MKNETRMKEQHKNDLGELQHRIAELEIECRKAGEETTTLRDFYEKILDGIVDGVWVTDKNDVIYYTNMGMAVIAGIDQDRILGAHILRDFPESTLKFFRPHYLNAKENLQLVYYEAVPQVTPAGRLSYQSGWLIPLVESNTFGGMICIVRDITERKLREEKLKKRISSLEDMVKRLSDEITIANDRLKKDTDDRKRMEEELAKIQKLESVGAIAGGIAHDFNNMLTTILGNISLAKIYIQAESGEEKALERLADAEVASVQANTLAQRLLAFSRIGEPVKKVISIEEMLRSSANFALSGSNVRCEFSIPDDLWRVKADEWQINQAISNLIINADQAMPEGGTIRICAENMTIGSGHALPLKDGEYVKVTIMDQGDGISEENIERIFEPFFTTKEKSSRLGLANSYSIIKKHDGHIAVESQVGKGTIFHIYIPASHEEIPVKKEIVKKKVKDNTAVGKGRVMVMDDEESIRNFLSEMLSSIGYEVTTAINGAEIIELYKESKNLGQSYDAVILDLTIPGGLGGKDTIQKLKEIDPEVTAIVSSGYSDDPIMANFEKYGFKGFIAKPYKIEEMSMVLHEAIAAQR